MEIEDLARLTVLNTTLLVLVSNYNTHIVAFHSPKTDYQDQVRIKKALATLKKQTEKIDKEITELCQKYEIETPTLKT